MIEYDAMPGLSTMHFIAWLAAGAQRVAEPDKKEATRAEWHLVSDLPKLIMDGEISDGPSLTALVCFLTLRRAAT